ncbi:MAG: hypothetical protein KAH56_02625 [Candidatus Krumholzibacteria bacterium]|nr:hypothetical protein [Candidatus Krumholzibacteria bacterium]
MKKLLFAVSALAALSLLAPSTGFASDHVYPNQVGMYEFSDGTGATGTFDVNSIVTVFLVLTKPEKDGVPYETINAFELTLNFNPAGNMFKLGEVYPGTNVDVGDSANIGLGYLTYIVGLAESHPVTDESFTLLEFSFMHTAPGIIEVSLAPTPKPGIDGEMAYQSVSGDLRIMYSAAGPDGGPVYIFDGAAVAVENESFGSVKSLYR